MDGCADRLATHSAEVGFTIEKKSGFESNTSVTCMHARGLADVEAQIKSQPRNDRFTMCGIGSPDTGSIGTSVKPCPSPAAES